MSIVDFGQYVYIFHVYIQMVLFYFWIHIFDGNLVWQVEDRAKRRGYSRNSREIVNSSIVGSIKSINLKSSYFEWGIYFIYLLLSYYFVNSIEKYIGIQIVFLFLAFCWKREKFFTKKMFFILFCLCIPEFIISCFRIGVEDMVQRYGIYKNLQQIFLARVLQVVLFTAAAVGNKRRSAEQKNLFYRNQFQKVQFFSEHIDILYHDLKHHLFTIDILIKKKEWEKATQYIEKLIGEGVIIEDLENTGNLVLDSMINDKRKIAIENGILFEARIEIPNGFAFDDFDMTVLLGNLLDNALYAAKETKSAFLTVFIKYNKKRLVIVVKNSVCGKENRILKRSQYGTGLQSVVQTISKYHGDLETGYNEGEFYAKVILFL